MNLSEAGDAQARRTARRHGLLARKSRWRAGTVDNRGGFQVVDPNRNWIVAGEKYDLTAEQVVRFCEDR